MGPMNPVSPMANPTVTPAMTMLVNRSHDAVLLAQLRSHLQQEMSAEKPSLALVQCSRARACLLKGVTLN